MWEPTGNTMPSHRVGGTKVPLPRHQTRTLKRLLKPWTIFIFLSWFPLHPQLTSPSWPWSWPASSWPKVVLLSPKSSAPKTTSRCFGSSSSSSRRCRPPSRRPPGTSLPRSSSSARVSGRTVYHSSRMLPVMDQETGDFCFTSSVCRSNDTVPFKSFFCSPYLC